METQIAQLHEQLKGKEYKLNVKEVYTEVLTLTILSESHNTDA